MADDTPEVPETLPETKTVTVESADAPASTPEPAASEAPQLPPKERRAARRAATAAAPSGPKTIEEREALRLERRRRNAVQRRAYRARAKTKRDERRAATPPAEPTPVHEHGPGRPKVRQGVVVSDKADKTIVVRIDIARRHRRYGKIMRTSTKLHAHDATNDAGAGDTVRLIESRPLSATKRWRLVEVVERAR
ncbi:MAG: 30S ribosomal protein S17 [Solirubrobacterales bacterium]|nr:30S ribosomal protein S17 [Solirubrobacterales bacterium]